jgi:hypothetical protein
LSIFRYLSLHSLAPNINAPAQAPFPVLFVRWVPCGTNHCARRLQNLQEEKAADKKLTEIAESKVNLRAA